MSWTGLTPPAAPAPAVVAEEEAVVPAPVEPAPAVTVIPDAPPSQVVWSSAPTLPAARRDDDR